MPNNIIADKIQSKFANIGTKPSNSKAALQADDMHVRGDMVSKKMEVKSLTAKDKLQMPSVTALPDNPSNGTIIYNTDLQQLQIYLNNEWKPIVHDIS